MTPIDKTSLVKAETNPKNVVMSIAKAFRTLEAFTAEDPELVLAEIARRAEIDNATAFRILNTLVMLGYVEKVGDTRRFRLTLRCLDLGFSAISRMDLRTLARPILQKLALPGVGAASIGVLDRHEVVYIERVQFGLTRLAVDIRIGTRIPAANSAIGRAILSLFTEARQRQELMAQPRIQATPQTETNLEKLIDILRNTRARGMSVVDQEWLPGLTAIAAPIVGMDGLPIAAVSLAIASSAMPLERLTEEYGPHLKLAAVDMARALQAAGGIAGG